MVQSYSGRFHHKRVSAWRKLAAAAGVGAVLLGLGIAVSRPLGPAQIPVVQADSRPLRLRPKDPGGLRVRGLDLLIEGAHEQAVSLAPPPEEPALTAIRAQDAESSDAPAFDETEAAPALLGAATGPKS